MGSTKAHPTYSDHCVYGFGFLWFFLGFFVFCFFVPKQALKAGKKVKLSHKEVMQKMGELFALR